MQNLIITSLEKVAEFHTAFSQPVVEEPTLAPIGRGSLRLNLISEELKELKQAVQDKEIVEVADGACDLLYVLMGTVLEYGLQKNFDLHFREEPTSYAYRNTGAYLQMLSEQLEDLEMFIRKADLKQIEITLWGFTQLLIGFTNCVTLGNKRILLSRILPQLFTEVHRSNMSKACKTLEEAYLTVNKIRNEGIPSYVKTKENAHLVFRFSDNKLVKSIKYSPANLQEIILQHPEILASTE